MDTFHPTIRQHYKKFPSLPNQIIRACVKGKRINYGGGYGLEVLIEYIFYGNQKIMQWAKRTSGGADTDANKKVLGCL